MWFNRRRTTHWLYQALGLTCDNASNNDVMVDHLGYALPGFEGSVGRVRCFAHVVNLVVKSLLTQFDVPK
ncbi:uncharacterized protein TRAVEDRAFT_114619, partial [Trametes versicolor FP-101664 SS1]|uniref:uncharacterized protein n=1 Tax=Trametes versicolor (strain FP-101664) TaxID=717944 RepID=UPI0004621F7E